MATRRPLGGARPLRESAGITSGIDASLRVITRLLGDATARRVAGEMRCPNVEYSVEPAAPPYTLEPADAILLVNAAFGGLRRSDIGLALYPGVGELDLSNIYDAHAHTMVAKVQGVGEQAVIDTAHGLTVLPSVIVPGQGGAKIRSLDRFVIPGPDAEAKAASIAGLVGSIASELAVEYLHAREPFRFGLEPVLEDLARASDVAAARFALRRMEYRSSDVRLRGSSLDWRTIAVPLALGWLGLSASLLWSKLARKAGDGQQRVRTRGQRDAATRPPCGDTDDDCCAVNGEAEGRELSTRALVRDASGPAPR